MLALRTRSRPPPWIGDVQGRMGRLNLNEGGLMRRLIFGLLGVFIGVAAFFAMANSSYAANGIRWNAGGNQTIGASGQIIKNGTAATCDVLLTISTDGTIVKSTALPTGEAIIAPSSITNCRSSLLAANGHVVFAPIPLRYDSISGTLPNITSINLTALNFSFSLRTILGITCTYRANLGPIRFTIAGGRINSLSFTGSSTLPSPGGLCPTTTITGSLTTFLPSAPTVTLI
jgi:hypothetical protein